MKDLFRGVIARGGGLRTGQSPPACDALAFHANDMVVSCEDAIRRIGDLESLAHELLGEFGRVALVRRADMRRNLPRDPTGDSAGVWSSPPRADLSGDARRGGFIGDDGLASASKLLANELRAHNSNKVTSACMGERSDSDSDLHALQPYVKKGLSARGAAYPSSMTSLALDLVTNTHDMTSTGPIAAAERWVDEWSPPPAQAACVSYPGAWIDVAAAGAIIPPNFLMRRSAREATLRALECGDISRVALALVRTFDTNGIGRLPWGGGILADFVAAVFAQYHLDAPGDSHIYRMYTEFDQERRLELDARECICLADALMRASLRPSLEQQRQSLGSDSAESKAFLDLDSTSGSSVGQRKSRTSVLADMDSSHPTHLAESWVRDYVPLPLAGTVSVSYSSGVAIHFEELADVLSGLAAANAPHRSGMIAAIENGELMRSSLDVYIARSGSADRGHLAWGDCSLRDFVVAVFQHYNLNPPSGGQIFLVYEKFTASRPNAPLNTSECLCLVDGLCRALFHLEVRQPNLTDAGTSQSGTQATLERAASFEARRAAVIRGADHVANEKVARNHQQELVHGDMVMVSKKNASQGVERLVRSIAGSIEKSRVVDDTSFENDQLDDYIEALACTTESVKASQDQVLRETAAARAALEDDLSELQAVAASVEEDLRSTSLSLVTQGGLYDGEQSGTARFLELQLAAEEARRERDVELQACFVGQQVVESMASELCDAHAKAKRYEMELGSINAVVLSLERRVEDMQTEHKTEMERQAATLEAMVAKLAASGNEVMLNLNAARQEHDTARMLIARETIEMEVFREVFSHRRMLEHEVDELKEELKARSEEYEEVESQARTLSNVERAHYTPVVRRLLPISSGRSGVFPERRSASEGLLLGTVASTSAVSGLKESTSSIVERWVATYEALPVASTHDSLYFNRIKVSFRAEGFCLCRAGGAAPRGLCREQTIQALESGALVRSAFEKYKEFDENGEGILEWQDGRGRLVSFIDAVLVDFGAISPPPTTLQSLYEKFDINQAGCLDAISCICFADAVIRSLLLNEVSAVDLQSFRRVPSCDFADIAQLAIPEAVRGTAVVTYLDNIRVSLTHFATVFCLAGAENKDHKERVVTDISGGAVAHCAYQVFQECAGNSDGALKWNEDGEIPDFINRVCKAQRLCPPSDSQLYLLFMVFDVDDTRQLRLRESVCMVDALFRSMFYNPEEACQRLSRQLSHRPALPRPRSLLLGAKQG